MKLPKEVIIGLSAISALLLLYFGFNFLKGKNVFSRTTLYYVVYDNVDGLTASNAVLFNGLKVGQVKSITLDPTSYKLVVAFVMNNTDVPITKNTIASIGSADMLGTKCLKLSLTQGPLAEVNDTLIGGTEAGLFDAIGPVKDKAVNLMSSMDSTLLILRSVMDLETQNNLKKTIANVAKTSEDFDAISKNMSALTAKADQLMASEQKKLSSILNNVESITQNFKSNNDKITHLLANLNTITDDVLKADVKTTIKNANDALARFNSIATKIDNGEGSMGKLINDKAMYDHLAASSKDLDALLIDMKARPSRYVHFSVFGKKVKEDPKDKK